MIKHVLEKVVVKTSTILKTCETFCKMGKYSVVKGL